MLNEVRTDSAYSRSPPKKIFNSNILFSENRGCHIKSKERETRENVP